jgi:hypothetical protein
MTNLSPAAVPLPPGHEVLLASCGIAGPDLPTDTTVWLAVPADEDEDRL